MARRTKKMASHTSAVRFEIDDNAFSGWPRIRMQE